MGWIGTSAGTVVNPLIPQNSFNYGGSWQFGSYKLTVRQALLGKAIAIAEQYGLPCAEAKTVCNTDVLQLTDTEVDNALASVLLTIEDYEGEDILQKNPLDVTDFLINANASCVNDWT